MKISLHAPGKWAEISDCSEEQMVALLFAFFETAPGAKGLATPEGTHTIKPERQDTDAIVPAEPEKPLAKTKKVKVNKKSIETVEKQLCEECERPGKFEHEGKHYCGYHNPNHKMKGGWGGGRQKRVKKNIFDEVDEEKGEAKPPEPPRTALFGPRIGSKDLNMSKYVSCAGAGCDKTIRKKDMEYVLGKPYCPGCVEEAKRKNEMS